MLTTRWRTWCQQMIGRDDLYFTVFSTVVHVVIGYGLNKCLFEKVDMLTLVRNEATLLRITIVGRA